MCNVRRIASCVFMLLILGVTVSAEGAMRLRIENLGLGQGAVISDNGAGDLNPAVGVLTFSGALPGFAVNVTTGVSDPPFASLPAGDQSLDLNSITVNASGPAILRIILENDGYVGSGGPGVFNANLGGVLTAPAGSAVTFQSSVNPTNAVPTLGVDTFPPAPLAGVVFPGGDIDAFAGAGVVFGPGAFASSAGPINFTTGALNSMYLEVTVNFAGAGSVSFDTFASFVDQGASAVPLPPALFAGLAMGVGVLLRRK